VTLAGIDTSTKAIDIVLLELDTDAAAWLRIPLHGDDAFDRVLTIRDAMPARGRWDDAGVVQIAIEKPLAGNATTSAIQVAWALGAALACLPRDVPLMPLQPSEWKKETLGGGQPGKGNAPKADVAAWSRAHWTNVPDRVSQDGLDAYAIAWAARSLLLKAADRQAGATPSTPTQEVNAA
jgi:Holliday junction resolvasome RuvABC endonuclease subunit